MSAMPVEPVVPPEVPGAPPPLEPPEWVEAVEEILETAGIPAPVVEAAVPELADLIVATNAEVVAVLVEAGVSTGVAEVIAPAIVAVIAG